MYKVIVKYITNKFNSILASLYFGAIVDLGYLPLGLSAFVH